MAEVRGLSIKLEGIDELQAQFSKVEKFPKKYLNKAARQGIADPLRAVKAAAPVGRNTTTKGTLKKSIKTLQETPNKRNKGVYRIHYNPKYTDDFRKPTTGVYGGTTPENYYPSSVEYGYLGKDGFVQPKTMYWMKNTIAKYDVRSSEEVIKSLLGSIDELLKKAK